MSTEKSGLSALGINKNESIISRLNDGVKIKFITHDNIDELGLKNMMNKNDNNSVIDTSQDNNTIIPENTQINNELNNNPFLLNTEAEKQWKIQRKRKQQKKAEQEREMLNNAKQQIRQMHQNILTQRNNMCNNDSNYEDNRVYVSVVISFIFGGIILI